MSDPLPLYLVGADYSYESNGDPVIRLFCKDEAGRSAGCFVRGFKPYFYVYPKLDSDDALGAYMEELKQRYNQIADVRVVERFLPFGCREGKKKLVLVVAKDPKQIRDLRESVGRDGTVYEADILFKNRFMVDAGLFQNSWIKVENWRPTNTNTVFTGLRVETLARHLSPMERDDHPRLRHLSVDIECLAEAGNGLPQPQIDPIIMISLAFSEPFEGREDLVLVSRPVGMGGALGFSDEREMLNRFVEIVRRYDPDVILGYNSNEFDLPYIIDRMRELGVRPKLGRADKNSFYRRVGNRTRVTITGRVVVDVFSLVKKDFPLKRYGLGAVAKEILGKDKLDVSHTEIPTLWRSRGKGLEKLVEYARKDAVLTLEILVEKNLLDRYVALAQASGTFLQDLIEAGQSIMIDNLLLRELRQYERVMPGRPDDEETQRRRDIREKEGLKGGHVLEPKSGLQENVLVMDYKSLYPTIMIANNICFSTLEGREFVKPGEFRGIVPRILEGLLEKRLVLKDRAQRAKDQQEFRSLDMTQWAVKILLNSFYGYFGYLRSRMYELIIANAVTSIGRDTIQKTKEIIENQVKRAALIDGKSYVNEDVAKAPKDATIVNLEVVYGDTDSVFVKLNPENGGAIQGEGAAALGTLMGKILTGLLPPPMELQYESFAQRSLFVTKKRYALYMEGNDPPIKVKGLETVRREWCNLATEAMTTVLRLLLEMGDVEEASSYMKTLIDDLRNNRTPVEKLIQTRTLSKRPGEYKGRQPHLELYKKLKDRDPAGAPQVGDRVPFVITHGKGLLVERAEDPDYVRENGLRIDHDYYIRRQILPPVRRIFEALDLGVDDLVADTQQTTLLDAFGTRTKRPRVAVPSPVVERVPVLGHELDQFVCVNCSRALTILDLADFRCPECGEELPEDCCGRIVNEIVELARLAAVKGGTREFHCASCGRAFRRIPLTGICECSGQVVPSSVDVEVGALVDLVEAAPPGLRANGVALQIDMIRTDFESIQSKAAPQMTLADFI